MNPNRTKIPGVLPLGPAKAEPEPDYLRHPVFAAERQESALRQARQPVRRRSVITQLSIFVVILLLWQFPIINPVKLLVVLFHEFSHMVVAYATGGVVFGIAIDPGGAGITLGMHGNEIAVLLAGYLGSFLIGAFIYMLCAVWDPEDVWGVLTMICCLSLCFGWLNSFTALFGYGTILFLLWGYFRFDDELQKFFIRVVATTCCLYPILDIWGELTAKRQEGFILQGRPLGSDMARLAELTGFSVNALSFAFISASVLAAIILIDWSAKKDAATLVKGRIKILHRRQDYPQTQHAPGNPRSMPHYRIR